MLFATVGQAALFIWMTAAGVAVGCWYAITFLLRRALQAGFWRSLLIDLLFGLGSAVILVLALVLGCYGQVRLFELLGALLGLAIFALGLMRPMHRLLRALKKTLVGIVTSLSKKRLIKIIFK